MLVKSGARQLAVALLALLGSTLQARQPDRWLEVRSPHFVVISNAGEQQARGVARQFERVRALLRRVLTNANIDPLDPVVVLAVNNERGLRELLPQFWERRGQHPVGGYWKGPHRHDVVLRVDASDSERSRRVLHEYVHLLTHVNVPDLPVWLDEGISEFWSTAVVQSDGVEIGRPALQHLKALRMRRSWIPLNELLAMERAPDARDSQRLSMFYAESWALTHYVMLGGSPTDLKLAPSLAFGNLSQLEQALTAYVRTGRFGALRIDVTPHEDENMELRVRALSPAESLAVRAAFLVDGERPAAALPLLREALAADPDETTALETLGYLNFRQNNAVEAARGFDRAIESGRASYLAYFYRAILAGVVPEVRLTASAKASAVEKPDPTYLLRRAIDLNPAFAEAYVRLADLYTQETDRLEEALPLMRRATELEPDNAGYWLELGKLLLGLNRPDEAREMGRRGLAVAPLSASSREPLEAFLRRLGP